MSRDLTSGMITEGEAALLRPVFFVEIDTAGGLVNLWNGIGQKSWNSKTWNGTSSTGEQLGGISDITEATAMAAVGIELTLSGIPADAVTDAMDEILPGKACTVWFGYLTEAQAVIVSPYQIFKGRCDELSFNESGETATMHLKVENRLIDLQRARERRYTHEDQQAVFPGDEGFSFVESLQELNVNWGQATQPIPQKSR